MINEMGASLSLSVRNVCETLAISLPTVLDAALRSVTKERCDARLDAWSFAVVRNSRMRLEIAGQQRLVPGETYIVMSNHQSLYDVPVLFRAFGPNIRMVAKTELFRIPVFGQAMAAAGFVPVDRGAARAAIRGLDEARGVLARGTHVWIAPEGTRSPTGKLLPFKPGALRLAADAQVRVAPVTLSGTREVLPRRSLRSTMGATVRVTIHEPIDPPPRDSGVALRRELMHRVREAVASALV